MKVIKISEVPEIKFDTPLFTGGPVTIQPLVPKETAKYFTANVVNFSRGARNKFHDHDGDQLLIVTGGKGVVATEQEEVTVSEGDIIFIPAGEKHWHGSNGEAAFSHIFIAQAGGVTRQLED